MLFTTKFPTLLLAVAAAAVSAQASVVSREELAGLSVTFFDDVSYIGKALSPDVVAGQCFDLPVAWQDRPESVIISPGWRCTFHPYASCAGSSTVLTGMVAQLPSGLYNNVHSFLCTKS